MYRKLLKENSYNNRDVLLSSHIIKQSLTDLQTNIDCTKSKEIISSILADQTLKTPKQFLQKPSLLQTIESIYQKAFVNGKNISAISKVRESMFYYLITDRAKKVYPNNPEKVEELINGLKEIAIDFNNSLTPEIKKRIYKPKNITEKDFTLVTYADSIIDKTNTKKPLQVLKNFLKKYNIERAHILPFYPSDTDRGFSPTDPDKVDPQKGSWGDISEISEETNLMVDEIMNHLSVDSIPIQGSLICNHLDKNHPKYDQYNQYRDFAITFSPENEPTPEEIAMITRPRKGSPLTPYFVVKYTTQNGQEMIKAFLGKPPQEVYLVKTKNNVETILLELPEEDLDKYTNIKKTSNYQIIGQGSKVYTTFTRGENEQGLEQTRQVDLNYKKPKVIKYQASISTNHIKNGASMLRLDAAPYTFGTK